VAAFRRFKELADRKGLVSSEDLGAILLSTEPADASGEDRVVSIRVSSATGETPTAQIVLELHGDAEAGIEPRQVSVESEGDGMVDAVCKAIRSGLGRPEVRLGTYQVGAVTGGLDALAEVMVTVTDEQGATFTGRGVSTDVVEASGLAYLDALNRSRRLVARSAEFRA